MEKFYNEDLNQKLQESERFSRTVLESSPDCAKIIDAEGKLKFMNYNGLCQMEIDDFAEFKDKLWWNLWGEENKELVKSSVKKALRGETNSFTAFCPTAKGSPKWWDVSVIPVGSSTAGISQILSVSRDITSQRLAEEKIKKLNEELEQKVVDRTKELEQNNIILKNTNEDLSKFNYIASHDLQEPLRKIQTFSNLILQKGLQHEDSEKHLHRILSISERMRTLIDSLHAFSLTRNKEIEMQKCDLNKILAEVKENLSEQISEKNVTINVEKLPSIKASKVLILQLFVNLIENSMKYSKSDVSPVINISTDEIKAKEITHLEALKNKDYYEISIADNGIGFDKQYENKIFDLFQRLHHKNEYSGTGIGLTIVKNILQKHNGFIKAEGKLNEGATFKIYLPKI